MKNALPANMTLADVVTIGQKAGAFKPCRVQIPNIEPRPRVGICIAHPAGKGADSFLLHEPPPTPGSFPTAAWGGGAGGLEEKVRAATPVELARILGWSHDLEAHEAALARMLQEQALLQDGSRNPDMVMTGPTTGAR